MDTSRLDKAAARLQQLAAVKTAPYGARISAEAEYAEAYQELVRAGVMPQIRAAYRDRKPGGKAGGKASGNAGTSAGKHSAHPDVPGYRRNGYKCEPKWNVAAKNT
jgi:hypothetical protein